MESGKAEVSPSFSEAKGKDCRTEKKMRTKILPLAIQALLGLSVFLLPLAFLPFFTDIYDFGKQVFFFAALFLIFLLWLVQIILEKRIIYKKSRYFLPVILLLAAFLASTFINSTNISLSFLAGTGVGAILLAALGYLMFSTLAKRKLVLFCLLASSVCLSLIRIVLFLGNFAFPLIFPAWNLSLTKAWSPTGSPVAQVVLSLLAIIAGFALMYDALKQQKLPQAALIFLGNTLNLVGLGLGIYLLETVAKPIFLPQITAWTIALESLKNGRFALFGLGPGQFVNAFTAFKPLSFNAGDFWQMSFASSSNWYYQLLTEVGLIGLSAYLFLAWKILKDALRVFRQPRVSFVGLAIYLNLAVLLLAQLFFPLNFFLFLLMFLLLAIARDDEPQAVELSAAGNFAFLGLIFPAAFWGVMIFFLGKFTLANNYFLESLKAASQNDGVKTYNLQIKAIQTDPSSPAYRMAYSQTNLALANALAGKKDLSDQDRSTITQLIQQAIREAKAAAAVEPRSASAWQNLASLYRSLVNFAEGANDWSIASYQEAINLDPLNPQLRIELGGVYYSQQNWIQAATLFNQAANLKPDLANAHYNLANALREAGDLQNSLQEYETAQTLVKANSTDYQKVTQELEEVKGRLPAAKPAAKASAPETLSTPQEPAAGINPPLELPNGGPNITPIP